MKKPAPLSFYKRNGFTLIELLLVIVILGILIVIALSIINPVRLQRRARESVLQAQVSKLCTALSACAAVSTSRTSCDEFTLGEIDANVTSLGTLNGTREIPSDVNNTPAHAYYRTYRNNNTSDYGGPENVRIQGYMCGFQNGSNPCANLDTGATSGTKSTTSHCVFTCDYNFDTGIGTPVRKSTGCY